MRRAMVGLLTPTVDPARARRPQRRAPGDAVVACAHCGARANGSEDAPPSGWRLVQTRLGVKVMCSERCDQRWHSENDPSALAHVHR